MEGLAITQDELGKNIEKQFSNFKKDSTSRKTEEYLKRKLVNLETHWSEFQSTHQQIALYEDSYPSHLYFKNNYYDHIRGVYMKYKELINNMLDKTQDAGMSATVKSNEHNDSFSTTKQNFNEEIDSGFIKYDLKQKLRKQQALINTIESFLNNLEGKFNIEQSKEYYQFKINKLMKYEEELSANHEDIWVLQENEDSTQYDVEAYHNLTHKIQDVVIALQQKIPNHLYSATDQQNHFSQNGAKPSIKLPKITLPVFDGNYLKWSQFRDLYTQLIHEQEISNAQKMFYLVTNLSGEARSLIQHLPISSENYNDAWNTLTSRYDNKRLLVTALINKFLAQPAIQTEAAASIKGLHDVTNECLLGLKNLGIDISSWDPILVHILIKKLDKNTHTLYEQSLQAPRELQSIVQFLQFLETRFQALEAMGGKYQKPPIARNSTSFVTTANNLKCCVCKQNHPLFACRNFLTKSPSARLQIVKNNNLCVNCLKGGHSSSTCLLRSCTKCSKRHNTLLHQDETKFTKPAQNGKENSKNERTQKNENIDEIIKSNNSTTLVARAKNSDHYVLLSTIIVRLVTSTGKEIECRAILDSGSQVNLITDKIARQLATHEEIEPLYINGIGKATQQASRRINIQVQSRTTGYTTRMEAFVMPKISNYQPTRLLDISNIPIPTNIKLADPQFYQPGPIDLLVGAEYYYELLSIGQIKLGKELPILQNTVFGWVVSGKMRDNKPESQASCNICTQEDTKLNEQVERFWTLEESDNSRSSLTTAEVKCETFFKQTTKRDENGRFIVRLPFAQDPNILGESKDIAMRRFLNIEKKLLKNPDLKKQYTEFMDEYIRLGHMKKIDFQQICAPYYFLPHHCVLRPDSLTTKLRVVFDASAKTSSNISLNDVLHTGPKIQDELLSVLLRFRMPKYVFTADIEKMYRQILIEEQDRKYQLILWRNDPCLPVECFQLNTVTYGVTTAPYLAIKCIQQLAEQQEIKYSEGAKSLKQNIYVDDLMAGSNTLHQAREKQEQISRILSSGGFKLRKWCANHASLLENIPTEDRAIHLEFHNNDECHVKALGLLWLPKSDEFQITTTESEEHKVTKRQILSEIAHLFDPLGIMSPVVVTAKIILQQLWSLKLDWDAAVPLDLHSRWLKFREGLKQLSDIRVPRHVFSHKSTVSTQLHAFSDASEKAYGAAIYVRSVLADGTIIVRLLCAKSKVAPLKTTTLPRLELCAAKLSAQLLHRVKMDLEWKEPCFLWTDSEIVLAWLEASSSSFHTFVANRIATIQQLTTVDQWNHVPSKQNPADIVSRGVTPEKFSSCHLWFYGPLFLHAAESAWPSKPQKLETTLEKKQPKNVLLINQDSRGLIETIDHRNSFKHLQRIVGYVLRFIGKLRRSNNQVHIDLTVEELNTSEALIIKEIQQQGFREDLINLRKANCVDVKSRLSSLSPFLDEQGIIRVGGRLEESDLSFNAKHPMLLPYPHQITKLIMTDIHITNAHAGPQTLLAITRQKFWPLKGKTVARSVVQGCVRCTRFKPQLLSQVMGNLPPKRVQPSRPFINTGIDFCGPFWIHNKIRGKKPHKAYVAIFCCFATKAVHIEVVSDLSTDAFIGALKRFVSRRGHCRHVYCDNATNFVGAKNKLKELEDNIHGHTSQQQITKYCTAKGIEFHFIPPRAPHFGGLWEAAVKSAKHLFYKSVTTASLTYEELETIMVEIEAILNSRPLIPMSNDPNDLTALTPGHFLIGEPLTSTVDNSAEPQKGSLIQRWKLVSHLKNQFWQRWTREYLSELQHRYKWKTTQQNIQPGMMVIIKEDNIPVLSWPLGRIIQTIKGNDGSVRVVDVKTSSGVLRRPIHKLAPLLMNDEEEDSSSDTINSTSKSFGNKNRITDDDDDGPTTSKRSRRSSPRLLSLLLLIGLILPALGTKIDVVQFSSQPGLYFEGLGTAHLISTEWNIVVYYDMTLYWKEFELIKSGIHKLGLICSATAKPQVCSETVSQFNHTFAEIANSNSLLLPQPSNRFKRAPLDIIGNVASSLFGILDSHYAEKMTSIISNLDKNDQHFVELLQNQTTIIDSTINIIKKSQETTESQLQEFDKYLNQTIASMMVMTKELNDQHLWEIINALSVRLILVITNYQRMQATLLDVLIDSNHGKVNPQLLSPIQLKDQLNIIKTNLPTTLRPPSDGTNLLDLYSVMTVEGRKTSNYIIFRLKLPVYTYDRYEIMRIIPVPILVNNTFLTVKPSSKFLILNMHRDQYYPLSEQEVSSCTIMKNSDYICKQRHPMYHVGHKVHVCEMDILLQHFVNPNCEITKSSEITRWIPLSTPNHWIYVLKSDTIIKVICDNQIVQRQLTGSGVINVTNGCSVKDDTTTLQTTNLHTSTVQSLFQPSINFTNLLHPEQLSTLIRYQPMTPFNITQDIATIKNELQNLHNQEKVATHLSSHDVHQYSISYSSLILILIVVICTWIRYVWNQRKRKYDPPAPLPRHTTPQFSIDSQL